MKTPAGYLLKRASGIYHFRIAIPLQLRQKLGKSEFHKSLNTREPRTARIALAAYLDAANALFAALGGAKVQDQQRKAALARMGINADDLTQLVEIENNGFKIKVDTQGKLSPQEEMEMALSAMEKAPKPMVVSANTEQQAPVAPPQPALPMGNFSGRRLSEVYERFKHIKGKRWSEGTKENYEAAYPLLISLLKDPVAATIDQKRASLLLDVLQSYPAHASKKSVFDGMTPPEIFIYQVQNKCPFERLEPKTINEYMGRITTLMDFAVQHGDAGFNPFIGLRVDEPDSEDSGYRHFEDDELKRIFESPHFIEHQYKHPYQYWIPVMGLYTGARVNELAGLTVDEIRNVGNDLWVIDFVKRKDMVVNGKTVLGRNLKNRNSVRTIPVHPDLIKLGLLDYLATRQEARAGLLFELKRQKKNDYGKEPSRKFGDLLTKLGLVDEQLVFHSFRHTLQVKLQLATVRAEFRSAYLGHSAAKAAMQDGGAATTAIHYGIKYPPEILMREVIPHIQFSLNMTPYKPVR